MRKEEINKIIDNISKITFHNLSYGNYYGFSEKYLISIHPYAIHIYDIIKKIKNYENISTDILFGTGNYIKILKIYHRSDYINNEIIYNPCEIYEKVSGYKSSMITDNNDESNEYWDNKKKIFNKYLIGLERKKKLININKSI